MKNTPDVSLALRTLIRPDAPPVWFPEHPMQADLGDRMFLTLRPYGTVWKDKEDTLRMWVIPAGFLYDGSSVPRAARSIVPPEPLDRASIFHDRGYQTRGKLGPEEIWRWSIGTGDWVDGRLDWNRFRKIPWTRRELDMFFCVLLREDPKGPPRWQRRGLIYPAVRAGGALAWKNSINQDRIFTPPPVST